jgi:hypothetical protein
MMITENLWGELPEIEKTRTPYNILEEQAELLGKMTKHELVGNVERHTKRGNSLEDKSFVLDFLIVAPSLDYTYSLFSVFHGVTMYPLRISSTKNKTYHCKNEEEYLTALKEILSSENTKKLINGLLIQIFADKTSSKLYFARA